MVGSLRKMVMGARFGFGRGEVEDGVFGSVSG